MRVGAVDAGDSSVQEPTYRDLFRRRLGVHVDHDDLLERRLRSSTSASAQRNGSSTGGMNVRPIKLRTPIVTPPAVNVPVPRPGAVGG